MSPSRVFAAPIVASQGISATYTYLAILFAVIFFLSILVIFKYFYLRHRRTLHARSGFSTPACSFTVDISGRSYASFLPSWGSINFDNEMAGYLVGFFGSPAWETGITKVNIGKITRKGYTNSHRQFSQAQASISPVPLASINFDSTNRSNGRSRPRSLFLAMDCPNVDVNRRFSLPSTTQANIQDFRWKRHSSPKRTPIGSETVFLSGNTPLGLAEEAHPELDVWMPLPPTLKCDLPSHSPSLFPARTFHAKITSELGQDPVAPMPVLPVSYPSSLIPRPVPHVLATSRISHPYALSQDLKYDTLQSPCGQDYDPHFFHSPSPYPQARHAESISCPRQPLATHFIDASPSEVATPLNNFSSLLSPPACLQNVVQKTYRATHKRKLSSLRVRRSPAIGPSPLRTMILPDVPIDASIFPASDNKENAGAKEGSNTDGKYSNFGLELRQLGPDQDSSGKKISNITNNYRPSSTNHGGEEDGASNMLLGIIRELVEETKEWDASLFMDENFKSMLFKCAADGVDNLGSNSRNSTRQFELDLESNHGHRRGPLGQQADMISFWEEGGWRAAHDHLENVGLAC